MKALTIYTSLPDGIGKKVDFIAAENGGNYIIMIEAQGEAEKRQALRKALLQIAKEDGITIDELLELQR